MKPIQEGVTVSGGSHLRFSVMLLLSVIQLSHQNVDIDQTKQRKNLVEARFLASSFKLSMSLGC